MFKCLGLPFPAAFISPQFCFSRHQSRHFGLLALPDTWCGNARFGAQVSSKYVTWYSVRVILQFMCVGSLAGVTYLRYTVLARSKKAETAAVHCCDPALSVLVVLVSRNVFHVVSALQSIAFMSIWWTNVGGVWLEYKATRGKVEWSGPKAGTGLRCRCLDSGYGNRHQPDDLKERRSPTAAWGVGDLVPSILHSLAKSNTNPRSGQCLTQAECHISCFGLMKKITWFWLAESSAVQV